MKRNRTSHERNSIEMRYNIFKTPRSRDSRTSRTAGVRFLHISDSMHFVLSRTYPGAGASRLSLYLSEAKCSLTVAVCISECLDFGRDFSSSVIFANNHHFLRTCCTGMYLTARALLLFLRLGSRAIDFLEISTIISGSLEFIANRANYNYSNCK